MAVILKHRIRVLRWKTSMLPKTKDLKGPKSCKGLVLFRAITNFFPSSMAVAKSFDRRKRLVQFKMVPLCPSFLGAPSMTKKLLHTHLEKKLDSLQPCNNLEYTAKALSDDLHCSFRFSPEILSCQDPNNLTVLAVEIEADSLEAEKYDQKVLDLRERIDSYCMKLVLGFGVEEIQQLLTRNIETMETKGVHEIEAAVELKTFRRNNISGYDDGKVKVCAICLQRIWSGTVITKTACSHEFHTRCINKWLIHKDSCPMCRCVCVVSV